MDGVAISLQPSFINENLNMLRQKKELSLTITVIPVHVFYYI